MAEIQQQLSPATAAGPVLLDGQRNGLAFDEKQNGASTRIQKETSKRSNIFGNIKLELSNSRTPSEKEYNNMETKPMTHHYVFQRPRALQYTYKKQRIQYGEEETNTPLDPETTGDDRSIRVVYTAEGIAKHRERVDLFIDLVWVGIISNLSEVYSTLYFKNNDNSGTAFLTFILVFLPSWRIWNSMREFLNSFYMDDMCQRVFIFWILVISVFFGNNIAYFAEETARLKAILVTMYLVIKGSFLLIELVYSFFIPWLRKLVFFNWITALPGAGLWIATIYLDGAKAVGPAVVAVMWEYWVAMMLDTPLGDKLTPGDYRKDIDPFHLRSRMSSFLIITLGEGVLMLIRGGPLGTGVTGTAGLAVWSLLTYFLLAFLYFNRDGSIRYVHAIRHRGWRTMAWIFWHIPLFACFIALSSSMLYLINRSANNPIDDAATPDDKLSPEEVADLNYRALWNMATSLSVIMFSYIMQALLDKPLDPRGTLLVSNRYLRLIGRPIYIIIVCTVLIKKDLDIYRYLGICALGLSLLMTYEWIATLERPAKIFEPKGLGVLMKSAYKSRDTSQGLFSRLES